MLVVYGDTIFQADLRPVLERGMDGMLGVKQVEDPGRFGVVLEEEERVVRLVEKPVEFVSDRADLVEAVPGGLASYCPHLRYLLLDEGALDESEALAVRNLAAALFRLEKSRAPQDLRAMVGALVDWLKAPEQRGLRRAFTVWIKRVLLPGRLPGVELPEVGDLQEVETMLSERVLEWTEQWKREGLEEGRQEGRQEGEQRVLQRQLAR